MLPIIILSVYRLYVTGLRSERILKMNSKNSIADLKIKAEILLSGIAEEGSLTFDTLDKANLLILNLYVSIDKLFTEFIAETKVEKEKGYEIYFQPVLEKKYPGRGWSYENIKRFRSINADPKKKEIFLNPSTPLSKEDKAKRKEVDIESTLKSAITRLNNVIESSKKKITLSVRKGLLHYEIEQPVKLIKAIKA